MAQTYFTPAAYARMSVKNTSSSLLLPGSGNACMYVINHGPAPVVFLLSTSAATVATENTGMYILPGQALYIGVGANTYISAIAIGAVQSPQLSISMGA